MCHRREQRRQQPLIVAAGVAAYTAFRSHKTKKEEEQKKMLPNQGTGVIQANQEIPAAYTPNSSYPLEKPPAYTFDQPQGQHPAQRGDLERGESFDSVVSDWLEKKKGRGLAEHEMGRW